MCSCPHHIHDVSGYKALPSLSKHELERNRNSATLYLCSLHSGLHGLSHFSSRTQSRLPPWEENSPARLQVPSPDSNGCHYKKFLVDSVEESVVLSAALCLPRGTEGHLRSWLLSKMARLPDVTSLWQPCLPDLDLPELLNSSFCCLRPQQVVSPNPKELSAVCTLRKRHQQSPIWEVWSGEQTKLEAFT